MTDVIARLFSRRRQDASGRSDLASARRASLVAGSGVHALATSSRAASRVNSIVAAALLLLLSAGLPAQEPSRATRKEITHLFEHLGQSGCEFFRNGSWHDSKSAVEHLQKKYVYLLARELVPTTESFIDRAATRSSLSGKPYRVRCAGQADIPSRMWFTAELARWRKPLRAPATPASGVASNSPSR